MTGYGSKTRSNGAGFNNGSAAIAATFVRWILPSMLWLHGCSGEQQSGFVADASIEPTTGGGTAYEDAGNELGDAQVPDAGAMDGGPSEPSLDGSLNDAGPEEPVSRVLRVETTGSGRGTVVSEPAGIACTDQCAYDFASGERVTISALPATGSEFVRFMGACEGAVNPCSVVLADDQSVSAVFALRRLTVTTRVQGDGMGALTMRLPSGAVCASPCEVDYGSKLEVGAAATSGSTFVGFNGGCSGGETPCVIEVVEDTDVQGLFTRELSGLSVERRGEGTVTSLPAGIDCGALCSATYPHGTALVLTATPISGRTRFVGWEGLCTGNARECGVTLPQTAPIVARFEPLPRTLEVTVNGAGSVSGVLSGDSDRVIACGADCNETVPHGTTIVLTATPSANYQLASFTGCSQVTGLSCTVEMTEARNVTASFELVRRTLDVVKAGNGSGTVAGREASSNALLINCGSFCSRSAPHGSETIVLTATADTRTSTFRSWSGCPQPSGATCTVPMTAAHRVTATFFLVPRTLRVALNGGEAATGGRVTGALVGSTSLQVDCPGDCTFVADHGVATIVLTARPPPALLFQSWSNCPQASGTRCTVPMTANRTVTAAFRYAPVP